MPRRDDPRTTFEDPRPVKVVLDPEAADELVDLLADTPGVADEELLDSALDAFRDPATAIPGPTQRSVGAGELVALQVEPEEATSVVELIENEKVRDDRMLRRLADRLRSRVQRARRRRGWRRSDKSVEQSWVEQSRVE